MRRGRIVSRRELFLTLKEVLNSFQRDETFNDGSYDVVELSERNLQDVQERDGDEGFGGVKLEL